MAVYKLCTVDQYICRWIYIYIKCNVRVCYVSRLYELCTTRSNNKGKFAFNGGFMQKKSRIFTSSTVKNRLGLKIPIGKHLWWGKITKIWFLLRYRYFYWKNSHFMNQQRSPDVKCTKVMFVWQPNFHNYISTNNYIWTIYNHFSDKSLPGT